MTADLPDHDTMRAAARLPGLDIEITRQQSAEAERISIHLTATPSFEAFGRLFEAANPFTFWAQAMQMAWSPWLQAAGVAMPPGSETQRKLPKA